MIIKDGDAEQQVETSKTEDGDVQALGELQIDDEAPAAAVCFSSISIAW